MAKKYHPDVSKHPGSTEKFKEINEAYQILGNPKERAKYDLEYFLNIKNGYYSQTSQTTKNSQYQTWREKREKWQRKSQQDQYKTN